MMIKTQVTEPCQYCGEPLVLREYEGMEGTWYADVQHVAKCPTYGQEKEGTSHADQVRD